MQKRYTVHINHYDECLVGWLAGCYDKKEKKEQNHKTVTCSFLQRIYLLFSNFHDDTLITPFDRISRSQEYWEGKTAKHIIGHMYEQQIKLKLDSPLSQLAEQCIISPDLFRIHV